MVELTLGPFSLDPSSTRLLRDGAEVKLRPQAFHALRVLLLHSGRTVSYEQLMAEAWHGIVVSRHTVDVTVAEVRKTLKEFGSWIRHRPKGGYCLEIPKSNELVRRGWHFWNLRTREGFEKALECFRQAAVEGPGDFRAFEGQSACHLMLFAYGMAPGRDIFQGFIEAHRQAVALAGMTPELRCSRAHSLHMLEHDLRAAESEFLGVLRDRPGFALAYVGLANLYSTLGRLDEALDCVARAYESDPLVPILPATEILIRFFRREYEAAAMLGAKAVELHPYLTLGRVFYAQALEFSGRLDEALTQYHIGAVMSQDAPWLRALEGVCLVKMQREAEARTMLEQLEELRKTVYVDAYVIALLKQALGDYEAGFAELERAVEENAGTLFPLDVDPKADCFRSDPRFAQVRSRILGDHPAPVRSI